MEKKKLLFFIKDQVPTKEELEEAAKIGTKAFRCAKFVGKTSPIEKADGYFGAVPYEYQHLLPEVKKLYAEKEEKHAVRIVEKEEKEKEMKPTPGKKVAWTPN